VVQIRVGKLRGDCNGPLIESCLKAVLATPERSRFSPTTATRPW
jgi:hypothetical protein